MENPPRLELKNFFTIFLTEKNYYSKKNFLFTFISSAPDQGMW